MSVLLDYIDAIPNPKDTVRELDKYIIGQTEAKKNLSVLLLVRALMKLQKNGRIASDIEIQKANMLLIGPTGSGKTALMKALSIVADIPILIKDMTGITSAGYIGGKVEDILIEYINLVDDYVIDKYNTLINEGKVTENKTLKNNLLIEELETGIIYLDEIDKLRIRDNRGTDINGDMVQNELLKILEGSLIYLNNSRHMYPKCGLRALDTTYISFVCGGAFHGISDIVHQRVNKSIGIGFSNKSLLSKTNYTEIMKLVTTDDLIKYGFKPEILGRLPLKTYCNELTKEVMLDIITKPKNCILSRYKEFFNLFNIDLKIDSTALDQIVEKALDLKMGARSLQQIFNDIFLENLVDVFELQNSKLHVTKKYVQKRLK